MGQKDKYKNKKAKTAVWILAGLFLTMLLLFSVGAMQAGSLGLFSPDDFWVRVNQKWSGDEDGSWTKPFIKFSDGWKLVEQSVGSADFPAVVVINDGHYAAAGRYNQPARLEIYDDGSAREGNIILEPFPDLQGMANPEDCPWGSPDCNRCVANVEDSFNNIRDHGEILGFQMGGHPPPDWGPLSKYHKHWQGVQRLSVAPNAEDAGKYMVITRDDIIVDGTGYSGFQIVYMGSRSGGGDRYRSNRLQPQWPYARTTPPGSDVVIKTQLIDDEHEHPGGIQVLGQFLIVGVGEEVHLYDLGNPSEPIHLGPEEEGTVDGIGPIFTRPEKSGSSTSLAKLQNGRYLLVISSSDARPLDFYISDEPNALLGDAAKIKFSNFDRVTSSEIEEIFGDKAGGGYQNINLVTECGSGQLYLLGTHNNGGCIGNICQPWKEDWADLYKVQEIANEITLERIIYQNAKGEDIPGRHFYCTAGFDPDNGLCNFDAAAGLYVDPDGQMILYATEHDNQGPDESVDFMEFRQVPRSAADPQGICSSFDEAWIELYRNDFADTEGLGESIMIDWADRDLEDYRDFSHFDPYAYPDYLSTGWWDWDGGRISSLSWCLPQGQNLYTLWEIPNFGGKSLALQGNGQVQEVPNLHKFQGANYGDMISSSCWFNDDGCAP